MGLSVLRIGDPQRRDRLLLLNALAILLTLLGVAGESLGMDRSLRTSAVKRLVPFDVSLGLPALEQHRETSDSVQVGKLL